MEVGARWQSAFGLSVRGAYTCLDTEVLGVDNFAVVGAAALHGRRSAHPPAAGTRARSTCAMLATGMQLFLTINGRGEMADFEPNFAVAVLTSPGYVVTTSADRSGSARTLEAYARVTNLVRSCLRGRAGLSRPRRSASVGLRVASAGDLRFGYRRDAAGCRGDADGARPSSSTTSRSRSPPADIVGILGPNGSGKTTLLRLLAGALTPHAGTVTLDGPRLARVPRRDLAQRMAVVPQETSLAFDYTALEIVLMGRYPASRRVRDRRTGRSGERRCARSRRRAPRHLADRAVSHAERRRKAARRDRVGARAAGSRARGAMRLPSEIAAAARRADGVARSASISSRSPRCCGDCTTRRASRSCCPRTTCDSRRRCARASCCCRAAGSSRRDRRARC